MKRISNLVQKLKNLLIEKNLPSRTLQTEFNLLDRTESDLLTYSGQCLGIQSSSKFSNSGKKEEIDSLMKKELKKLAELDNKSAEISQGIKTIEGTIINKIAVAKGKARVIDATAIMLEHFQQIEVRQQIDRQQDKAEKAHNAKLEKTKSMKFSLSDQERRTPNIAEQTYLSACESFPSNNDRNRLIINAIENSPIEILPGETIKKGNDLLALSVCPEQISLKGQAMARLEALDIIQTDFEGMIRSPLTITPTPQFIPTMSDQGRAAA